MRNYTNILIGALLAFAMVAPSYASVTVTSGTVTVAVEEMRGGIRVVSYSWTCDSGGNVVATTNDIEGEIRRFVVNPADGASSPTDNYDLTVTDRDSIDIIGGQGANLSQSTNTNTVCTVNDGTTYMALVTRGTHTITITNAGNAKSGVIRFYTRY
jgi:hypothetical protein